MRHGGLAFSLVLLLHPTSCFFFRHPPASSSCSLLAASPYIPMHAPRPSYLEPEELLVLLQRQRKGEEGLPRLQIIDVRDDDFEVAKLPGSINVPSEEWHEDERVDALVQEYKDHDLIVFHCMLSQQRGPFTATRFLARLSLLDDQQEEEEEEEEECEGDGSKQAITKRPEVKILRGGFQKWYHRYRKELGMVVPCQEEEGGGK